MREALEDFFKRHGFHEGEGPYITGVSGGPDSLALLHCLAGMDMPLVCAHLNHGLRPEAGDEEDFVRDFAASLGIPFVSSRANVGAFSKDQNQSMEEAARNLRYSFLFAEAEKMGARAVLTAHTADDQVETILMHLVRGAGLSGLKGMAPETWLPQFSRSVPLVRPMLAIWREAVLDYCRRHTLTRQAHPNG